MKITLYGAAGTVTGSRTLCETSGKKFLVDAGLFQGPKDLRLLNWTAPFKSSTLDGIILTHAHIDHTGLLPRLVKEGYSKPIWCSKGTAALCKFMLLDAAKLQEEDAKYANDSGYSHHKPAEPLYTIKDAEEAIRLLEVVEDEEWFSPFKNISFRFYRAGHILGSRFVQLSYPTSEGAKSIIFTGDLGNGRSRLIKPAQSPPQADCVMLESTYGDRLLPHESPLPELGEIINKVTKRGGILLIPAFAVGRTQDLLEAIGDLQRRGVIDSQLPVYVDSPMARSATKAHLKFPTELLFHTEGSSVQGPLDTDQFRCTESFEESIALQQINTPHILISASGMVTGGRIMHHLKLRLPDPKNGVLFVGYQAQGTKGRVLVSGEKDFRIHHQRIPVAAEIFQLHHFSAHADYQDSMKWLSQMPVAPKKIILNHGEPDALTALKDHLLERWPETEIVIAEQGEEIHL
ncbi:MAG: MBL fold metallo-hydrolase [Bacteriovoracaceae bacterium]|nr:MBL fold metallo-hydrolase [Bacteriovoracaceae bacterium]